MSHETVQHGPTSIDYRWPRAVNLPYVAGAILSIWLLLSGGVLVLRRATGATNSLEPAALMSAGVLLTATAFLIHLLAALGDRSERSGPPAGADRRWATALGLATNGFGLGALSTAWWTGLVFWALIVGEEVWSWKRYGRARPVDDLAPPRGSFGVSNRFRLLIGLIRAARRKRSAAPASDESPKADGPAAPEADGRIFQRYVRSLTDAGEDLVRGTLRVAFLPGARLALVHVAFCPPFARRPRFEARQTAGPVARLKVAQVLSQGARLEVRLPAAAAVDDSVELIFTAVENELP